MDTKTLYELIQSKPNLTEKKRFIQTLTEEQKKEYTKYSNKIRQAKFASNPENKEKYNKVRAEYKKEIREKEPEKHKILNIKYVADYRQREKEKDAEDKKKEMPVLTKNLYKLVVNDAVKEGDIITKKDKKNQYQKEYKQKAKTKAKSTS